MDDRALMKHFFEALERSIDAERLESELTRRFGALATAAPTPRAPTAETTGASELATADRDDVLGKLVLADLLDDAILGARPGDKGFPLRLLLAQVGERLGEDVGLAFACGLGFYFRAAMDEETKLRVGIEVSRLFYVFAGAAGVEKDAIQKTAPLLATLMTSELTKLRFESVDHAAVFDSEVHERDAGSDAQNPRIVGARTFLCRVARTDKIRAKAVVRT
jgi:hypothetical protein